jgi:hypothetical protein
MKKQEEPLKPCPLCGNNEIQTHFNDMDLPMYYCWKCTCSVYADSFEVIQLNENTDMRLGDWLTFIEGLIDKHGKDAVLSADACPNNAWFEIKIPKKKTRKK